MSGIHDPRFHRAVQLVAHVHSPRFDAIMNNYGLDKSISISQNALNLWSLTSQLVRSTHETVTCLQLVSRDITLSVTWPHIVMITWFASYQGSGHRPSTFTHGTFPWDQLDRSIVIKNLGLFTSFHRLFKTAAATVNAPLILSLSISTSMLATLAAIISAPHLFVIITLTSGFATLKHMFSESFLNFPLTWSR